MDNIPPVRVTLKDGTAATIRALRADDRERMAAAVRGLDAESIYTRLFSHRKELTQGGLDRIMRTDPATEIVLVATVGAGNDEKIIGSGRYVATPEAGDDRCAEIAFVVEEDYHGQGVAGRLLAALADVARQRGVRRFDAEVLADNPSMVRVFERSGLPLRKRSAGGVVHVVLDLAPQASSKPT